MFFPLKCKKAYFPSKMAMNEDFCFILPMGWTSLNYTFTSEPRFFKVGSETSELDKLSHSFILQN